MVKGFWNLLDLTGLGRFSAATGLRLVAVVVKVGQRQASFVDRTQTKPKRDWAKLETDDEKDT